ncbi:MAG: chorismate-binding protein, partial [Cytophagaceae bacterium]
MALNKISAPTLVQLLNAHLHNSVENKYAFSAWRLPGMQEYHILYGPSEDLKENFLPENANTGFCFYPFEAKNERTGFFIKQKLHVRVNASGEVLYSSSKEGKDLLSENQTNFYQGENIRFASNDANFHKTVALAIQSIEQSPVLKKVVLARNKEVSTPNVDPALIFKNLSNKYPNAFISLTSHPIAGTWIGASPEILVSVDKNKIFRTVALAGTQAASSTPSEAVWTQKEIEEQALVSRYIINCFKHIRLREFEEDGPETIKAGNLFHLKTSFSVNTREVNNPQLGGEMLQLLHPTSAVCGMPKEEASDFINKNEKI